MLYTQCSVLRHTHPPSAADTQSHSQGRGLNTGKKPHGVTAQLYPSSSLRFRSQHVLSSYAQPVQLDPGGFIWCLIGQTTEGFRGLHCWTRMLDTSSASGNFLDVSLPYLG